MYQAEYSMLHSFRDNDIELIFAIDTDAVGQLYWSYACTGNIDPNSSFIRNIPSDGAHDLVRRERPDLIIHRYYNYRPVMHWNAYLAAKQFNIPFIYLDMEREYPPNELSFFDLEPITLSRVFLHAHPLHEERQDQIEKTGVHMHFYPYGVSSFERYNPIGHERDLGAFGFYRNMPTRTANAEMFFEGARRLGKTVDVFADWNEYHGPYREMLNVCPRYNSIDTVGIMSNYKIALDFHTYPDKPEHLSHKTWQTVGCGLLTLSPRLQLMEQLFGPSGENLVYVQSSDEVECSIREMLANPQKRMAIARRGEKYVHEKFDWFKRFNEIMVQESVWS